MGKGGLVTYEASDFFKLLFQIRGSIFDNVLSKVRSQRGGPFGSNRAWAPARKRAPLACSPSTARRAHEEGLPERRG